MWNLNMADIMSILGIVGTILFAYLAFRRADKTESKDNGRNAGQIASDMGYVKKGIEDINSKLERGDERHLKLCERVGKVEESAKSAHKRMDRIEGKEERE